MDIFKLFDKFNVCISFSWIISKIADRPSDIMMISRQCRYQTKVADISSTFLANNALILVADTVTTLLADIRCQCKVDIDGGSIIF